MLLLIIVSELEVDHLTRNGDSWECAVVVASDEAVARPERWRLMKVVTE